MGDLTLVRMSEVDPPGVTFGRLESDETREQLCFTLEHVWVDKNGDGFGDRNVSRIPAGRYKCRVAMSPSRGFKVIWIDDVPGRSDVQMHPGNFKRDSRGCALVGSGIGKIDGEPAVLDSRKTFKRLIARVDETFYLTVKDI